MAAGAAYDTIGVGYSARRRPDPRIERQIVVALDDAASVLNVGAGTGSYEPVDRHVVAVEPSAVMIAQRPAGSAEVVRAVAERLPFPDDAFDAALAVLTVHHWSDPRAGMRELCRVAPRRVMLTFDPSMTDELWLVADYLPAAAVADAETLPRVDDVARALGATRIEVVPVPHDCIDGFAGAYWRRPEAYLDPAVHAGISLLANMPDGVVGNAMARLREDLASGAWHERHGDLLALDEVDLGYRLVIGG